MKFNKNFYTENKKYTIEMAKEVMIKNGYKDFYLTGSSFTNGASFYFETLDSKKVRVSDHPLTGKRAFELIQLSFVNLSAFSSKIKEEVKSDLQSRIADQTAKIQAKKLQLI